MRRATWVARLAVLLLVIASAAGALWVVKGVLGEFDRATARTEAVHAVERMVAQVTATPDGRTVDLAKALTIGWDRAVLMEPYADGAAMNRRLGFDGFPADAEGPQDESSQLVVFVRGTSVVAQADLFPQSGSFRFDPSITEFDSGGAEFVVQRDGDLVNLARP